MITTPEQMREAAIQACEDCIDDCMDGLADRDFVIRAIRAIPIAPQPVAVTVKPLVWNTERMISGDYRIHVTFGQNNRPFMLSRGSYIIEYGDTETELQIKAQSDHQSRILSSLTIKLADPLSDPRVVALVKAAMKVMYAAELREYYHRLPNDKNRIGDQKSTKSKARDAWIKSFRRACSATDAALRAIGGES